MQAGDNLQLDSPDLGVVGSPDPGVVGSPDPEVVDSLEEDNHMLVVEVDIQPSQDMADQCETSVDEGVPPLVVDQIYHPFCPFQPCAVSACRHRPCNKLNQPIDSVSVKPPEVHHFPRCMQLRKICMQVG